MLVVYWASPLWAGSGFLVEEVTKVADGDTLTIRSQIEDHLAWKGVLDTHIITLTNYQNLLECVHDIRDGLVLAHEILQLPSDTKLLADITGGTKVMTAALTLVMMEYPNSRFTYTGGKNRTKDGLGIVYDGDEEVMVLDNPSESWLLWKFNNLPELLTLANLRRL